MEKVRPDVTSVKPYFLKLKRQWLTLIKSTLSRMALSTQYWKRTDCGEHDTWLFVIENIPSLSLRKISPRRLNKTSEMKQEEILLVSQTKRTLKRIWSSSALPQNLARIKSYMKFAWLGQTKIQSQWDSMTTYTDILTTQESHSIWTCVP